MVCLNPPRYAELHALSNFSFQRGASSADELFERAADLGYDALAITDECSLAGIVRALEASEASGVPLIVGTEINLDDGPKLVLLASTQAAYAELCRIITLGRRRSAKGEYQLGRADLESLHEDVLVLWAPAGLAVGASSQKACVVDRPAQDARKIHALRSAWTPSSACRHLLPQAGEGKMKCVLPQAGEGKGKCVLPQAGEEGTGRVLAPARDDHDPADATAAWIAGHFGGRSWIAVELHRGSDDAGALARLQALGQRHGLPLVASGDVHMHVRGRRALQDALTAIRLGCTVAEAGHALFPNGERHLRRIEDLVSIYPPALIEETAHVAARCRFNLRRIHYVYPHELVPQGMRAIDHLRALTLAGACRRWPQGIPASVSRQLEHEFVLIERLGYEHFFLTVEDIVRWARAQRPPILCQGRGSSANSAVCYCLGITAVDPEHGNLLFERFLSIERDEPPDIDVDFEHERREEVIQYVFNKYGRTRAALAATVIRYRGKSAARDIGRVLGLAEDQLDQLSQAYAHTSEDLPIAESLRERGFDPQAPVMRRVVGLVAQLRGFPRHLSQHVGGFVISEHPLHTLVPVENAAMADRTIIQWDKDDLESLKLLKVDCLALGMLTCLRKCFDLVRRHEGRDLELATVPQDDADTYAMIRAADTVGVFQIESRAQMSMLPRLRPAVFYDLVVQVAIVRPGPIQGGMVHPYLRRRQNLEAIDYPQSASERATGKGESRVRVVLERTLGVPIFQEQVMKLVEVVAGFTPGQADELRRAMAAWKRKGGLEPFRERIRDGMLGLGYEESYFERIFEQIKGFGDYGFPESHSASFALLAYASSWLKCHYPAAFTCALLNSLPMGFYGPAQLIRDAQRHGVRVLPVDVTISMWDCTLEDSTETRSGRAHALRLGFSRISGLSEATARRIVEARNTQAFRDIADLVHRAGLNAGERARLADADALRSLSGHRHQARWDSAGVEPPIAVIADAPLNEESIQLTAPSLRADVMSDYASQGFTLRRHPLALVRDALDARRMLRARDVLGSRNGRRVRCAGLVTVRQRPGTAKGVTFVTLEDETGILNIIVWAALASSQRRVLIESAVLGVEGELQSSEGVQHVIAHRLLNLDALLPELGAQSRDFH
ncbi:error-prone DNA polymerase [Dokdonella immobilis]|uniref:Error-prone DNA polymerase n=1 Tax=Dokdonella immobilis TaxID=578942 RepID=A0A1I4VXT8_9GAMM|nr:error-prone DNA polymerase [Dokdonella immobilis]SFN05960.1 error-prone DNA polymerase [Dokdonella immobilis]